MSEADDIRRVADQIAAQLGERAIAPSVQIRRIVRVLGAERAQAFAREALAIEAQGGLRVPDGSRRRTLGGVFFHLVKARVKARERWLLFRRPPPRNRPPGSSAATPTQPDVTWKTRKPAVREALREKGAVDDVKIVLVGRPGAVVQRPNCVITAMDSTRGPSLPQGLPAIPATPTTYTVYIAHKHWARVAAALTNPDDALVVEGWAAFDPELEGIAVFATFVTTKLSRAAQQRRNADEEDSK
jgi:hypothetical protein